MSTLPRMPKTSSTNDVILEIVLRVSDPIRLVYDVRHQDYIVRVQMVKRRAGVWHIEWIDGYEEIAEKVGRANRPLLRQTCARGIMIALRRHCGAHHLPYPDWTEVLGWGHVLGRNKGDREKVFGWVFPGQEAE